MKHPSQALNTQDLVHRMADAVEEIDGSKREPANLMIATNDHQNLNRNQNLVHNNEAIQVVNNATDSQNAKSAAEGQRDDDAKDQDLDEAV